MGRATIGEAELVFATLAEARQRISTSDEYTRHLSAYELQAKVQRAGELTEGDYLANAARFARAWTKDEVEYIAKQAEFTERRLQDLKVSLNLPAEIWIIKTTGSEEGGANGYTRGNSIFFNMLSLSLNLLRHELFHVATRHNSDIRDACFATVGFEPIEPVSYIDPNRISNPDAPGVGHAARITYRGQARRVAIVLSGNRPYAGGSFFSYVSKRLLSVDDTDADLLDFGQVAGLYDLIGRNTAYNIHQEEVCASHFEMLLEGAVSVPQPHLINGLLAALTSGKERTAQ